jgi:hypothetical protein
MPVQLIQYKGKQILYLDFRNLTEDKMIENLNNAAEVIKNTPNSILLFTDLRDTLVSGRFTTHLKKMAREVIVAKTEKSAVIGIDSARALIMQTYIFTVNSKVKKFETEEEAKEYLVK